MKRYVATARYPVLAVLAALSVVLFIQITTSTRATARAMYPPPPPDDVATALIRTGLAPEALAAAGASASDAQSVWADALDHLAIEAGALAAADTAWGQARQTCDALRRIIQSGRATDLQADEYASARTQLAQAASLRDGLENDLLTAATAHLSAAERSTLEALRRNRAWKLAIEFRAKDRPEPEWVLLRDYLAAERIALTEGDVVPTDVQTALAAARSEPAVAAAAVNYQVNIDAVASAWGAPLDAP